MSERPQRTKKRPAKIRSDDDEIPGVVAPDRSVVSVAAGSSRPSPPQIQNRRSTGAGGGTRPERRPAIQPPSSTSDDDTDYDDAAAGARAPDTRPRPRVQPHPRPNRPTQQVSLTSHY